MKKIISFNNIDPRKKVLVIGAGYSGLLLGLMLKEKEIPYLIVEKNSQPGGVWISQGNATSKVQIDPVAYAALSAATSIPPAYTPTKEITAEFKRIADGLDIAYNVNVQKITKEGKLHRVQLLSGGHIDAAAVAIRTGTLTQPKAITYPNESIFKGTITYGIKNNISPSDFKGKNVVIVGMGAFAIENMRTAFENGAKHITIVARHIKPVLPKMCSYEAARFITNLKNMFVTSYRNESWNRFFTVLDRMYQITGNQTLINRACTTDENGDRYFNCTGSAVSDTFFIALSEGKLTVIESEIASFNKSSITTKSNETIDTDMVVKCIGSTCDTTLAEKPLTRTIFMNGPSFTHNLRADCIGAPFIMGPNEAIPIPPLVSYAMLSDVIDTTAIYFLSDVIDTTAIYFYRFPIYRFPKRYQAFINKTTYMNPKREFISNLNYQSYIEFFWSILTSGETGLVEEIYDRFAQRKKMYQEKLNYKTAYENNQKEWEQKTNTPYPLGLAKLEGLAKEEPTNTTPVSTYKRLYKVASWVGIDRVLGWLKYRPIERLLDWLLT